MSVMDCRVFGGRTGSVVDCRVYGGLILCLLRTVEYSGGLYWICS